MWYFLGIDENAWKLFNSFAPWFAAFGTLAVAFIALWTNWLHSLFIHPKLTIHIHNIRGVVACHPERYVYYHLKVVNSHRWAVAKDCRVILRKISKKYQNNNFQQLPLPVPMQFAWAPKGVMGDCFIDLDSEEVLEFGRVMEGEGCRFEPILSWDLAGFEGKVGPHETVQYVLEVRARGYNAKKFHVFEVFWNGIWTDNLDEMAHNLVITDCGTVKR